MSLQDELQSIISGIGRNSAKNLIEAAAGYLGKSKETGSGSQTIQLSKGEEATRLTDWIEKSELWFKTLDEYVKTFNSFAACFYLAGILQQYLCAE